MSENDKMLPHDRMKWGYLFLILCIIALPAVVGAEEYFVLDTSNPLPYVITHPGTFVLNDVTYGGGPVFASTPVVIRIQSDDVVLDGNGFTITGDGGIGDVGVLASGFQRVHVKNIHVQSFDRGIYFNAVTDGKIENVEADLNIGAGIRLDGCTNIDVNNNNLHHNFDGLYLYLCNNIDVYENLITSNSNDGIYSENAGVGDGHHDIHENEITSNGNWGIILFLDTGSTIRLNNVSNNGSPAPWGGGIAYVVPYPPAVPLNPGMASFGVIDQNRVENNPWYGIWLLHSRGTTVTNNYVHGSLRNIILENSPPPPAGQFPGNLIADNTIEGMGINTGDIGVLLRFIEPPLWAIQEPCYGNTIGNNTISQIQIGIQIEGSGQFPGDGNNVIIDNTITTIDQGIVLRPNWAAPLRNSNFNSIINNTIEYASTEAIRLEGVGPGNRIQNIIIDGNQVRYNHYGIFLDFAEFNTIRNNNIIDSTVEGLTLKGSPSNLIYNNCFNNTVNVGWGMVAPWANKWETLVSPGPNIVGGKYLGGNYWAKPDGTGPSQITAPNSDEFLVYEVVLDGGLNVDYHPLWNPINASFTATPTSGPAPLTVSFTDTSYGYPTCWLWDFGDSTTSDEQNPTHTYAVNGDYTVTLTVWRCAVAGCAAGDTASTDIAVGTFADFTATPTVGPAPLTVTFTDLSIGSTGWTWSYDDGSGYVPFTQEHEQNPIQVFTTPGLYDIKLQVTGSAPDEEIKTAYIDVRVPLGPVADFTASSQSGDAPLTVDFIDLSYGNVTDWDWDFGGVGSSSDRNPSFTFVNPGVYTVNLTVINTGGTDSKTLDITVNTPALMADFTASPQSGDAPLTVNFGDLSLGNVTDWDWDFGGAGTSNDRNPSFTFVNPGVYTVNLTVTDTYSTDSKTLDITVNTPALMADFTASPQSGDAPLTVDFIDLSIGNVLSWSWDFGDASPVDTTRSPSHTYTTAGDYTVTLTVTDAYSTDTKTLPIHVATPVPVANFLASPRSGYTNLEVFFYDRTTGTTSTTTYLWNFGDSGTSTERDPKHTYTAEGPYTVTLTVTNPGPPGFTETSSITKTDYIVVSDEPIPVATILSGSIGDMPFTVDFTSVSTYSPITWLWNFGDGASANQQNVTHTFLEPGIYDVTLRVFDEQGRGTQDTVAVTVRPVANFMADHTVGDAPLTVQFTDTSQGNPDVFYWEFDDGAYSWDENPSHTYINPGTYYVRHEVWANGIQSLPKISPIAIGSTPAIIADPTSGKVPLTVTFEGISGGYPVDWLWEFGNGHYQVGSALATYTYTETGVYTVTLTAYYNDRDPVSTTQIIKVGPVADFTMTPGTGNAPLTVQFTDTSLGTIANYHWVTLPDGWTSNAKDPSHTFTASGCHYVLLTVETPEGLTDEKVKTIAVYPTADFTWYPVQGDEPLTVQFVDTSVGGGQYSTWYFGDGTTATFWDHPGRSAPVHVYQQLGTYQVSLTRMGYDALPNTTTKEVNLLERPPVADFTGVPRAGSAPHVVDFTDLSSGVSPMTYLWNFGDGSTPSTAKNPSHTYTANGDYTVTLTVTNGGGPDTETKAAYIRVSDVPLPFAEFTASPLDGIEDLTVQFLDKSGNSPTSWLWQFGDGSTSTLQSPLYTYTTPGWYNVILTVSNAQGQNSIAKSSYIYVRNTPPVAAFDASPRNGDAPLTVQFSDTSLGSQITSWLWNFGDGSTSTTQNPLYVYNTAGTYTVTLTVANDGGSDAEVKNAYITVNPAQQANHIKLYPGWNFVSVPKKLASGQNTAIQVFGGVDLGGRAILLWDASTGSWKQVMAGDEVKPLNGYWVYSVTRIDVPLTFDTVTPPSPTSKQLYAGWNAIGYAGTTSMSARNFLTLGGGLNGNWIQLLGFSQGINPDIPIIRDSNDGLPMYPTKGYWIAMSTNDTLTVVV